MREIGITGDRYLLRLFSFLFFHLYMYVRLVSFILYEFQLGKDGQMRFRFCSLKGKEFGD